jgi:5-methylcytosine-specific restriction protein A
LLGADAWGGASAGKWKFLTLPIPGREPITDFPDQITQPERLPEGASKIISVNAYERSRKARDHCIRHYGTRCCVCEMDFKERYGELGIGFIHVHHLKMLSEIGAEYEIDPIKDLRPVCPNCHAMLHRTAPPLSIDELRLRLKIPTPD